MYHNREAEKGNFNKFEINLQFTLLLILIIKHVQRHVIYMKYYSYYNAISFESMLGFISHELNYYGLHFQHMRLAFEWNLISRCFEI